MNNQLKEYFAESFDKAVDMAISDYTVANDYVQIRADISDLEMYFASFSFEDKESFQVLEVKPADLAYVLDVDNLLEAQQVRVLKSYVRDHKETFIDNALSKIYEDCDRWAETDYEKNLDTALVKRFDIEVYSLNNGQFCFSHKVSFFSEERADEFLKKTDSKEGLMAKALYSRRNKNQELAFGDLAHCCCCGQHDCPDFDTMPKCQNARDLEEAISIYLDKECVEAVKVEMAENLDGSNSDNVVYAVADVDGNWRVVNSTVGVNFYSQQIYIVGSNQDLNKFHLDFDSLLEESVRINLEKYVRFSTVEKIIK